MKLRFYTDIHVPTRIDLIEQPCIASVFRKWNPYNNNSGYTDAPYHIVHWTGNCNGDVQHDRMSCLHMTAIGNADRNDTADGNTISAAVSADDDRIQVLTRELPHREHTAYIQKKPRAQVRVVLSYRLLSF